MKDFKNSKTNELLSTSDAMERRHIIESLDPDVPKNYETLLEALKDTNKGVRDAASQILMLVPSAAIAESLAKLLAHENIEVRNLASELLISFGEIAVGSLLSSLSDDDGDVRKFAVDILGLIRDDRSFKGLIVALDDEEPNVVVSAAEALGNLGNLDAVPHLISHFRSVEGMEYVVIDALGRLQTRESVDFLMKIAVSDELTEAQVALNALQNIHDVTIADDLYKQLDYLDPILRAEAVASVIQIYLNAENILPAYFDTNKYSEEVCDLLRESEQERKNLLVQVLSENFISQHVLFFTSLNAEQDEELDHIITSKLAAIETDIFLKTVEEHFQDAELAGQVNLALILAQKEMPAAIPYFEQLLQRPEPAIKESILQVISAVSHPAAVPLLKRIISEHDETLLESAYFALANFKTKENQPIFEKGLQNPSIAIKEICGEALTQIAPERLSEIIAENLASTQKDNIIFALDIVTRFSMYGSFQTIVVHLDHDAPEVRVAALHALANFEFAETFDAVEFLLYDKNDDVRRAAFDTLLKIDIQQAERPVQAALSDESFWLQIAGIEKAQELKLTGFKDELLSLSVSSNKMVQMKAIESLLDLFDASIEEEITERLNHLGEAGISLLTTAKEQRDADWF